MMTTIGTPANHRMMSRNMGFSLRRRAVDRSVHTKEPGWHRRVTMIAALLRGPPGCRQRDKKARRGHKSGENTCVPGLIGGFAGHAIGFSKGLVDTTLGLGLWKAGALGNDGREIATIIVGQ